MAGSGRDRRQDERPSLDPDPVVVLALAIGVVAAIPFLLPDFPATRDSLSHLFRVWALGAAMEAGALYPRWLPDFVFGYGYPLFNFYSPLLYFLAAPLRGLGLDTLTALRLPIAGSVIVAAVGAYLLGRAHAGRAGGLVASAGYAAAPYFHTDLLVRGAFPEALAMAWLPWALWALGGESGRRWTVLGAVAVALLVLSHNAVAFLGLPLIVGYGVWVAVVRAETRRETLVHTGSSVALGLALSAFFWAPAVGELDAVWLGDQSGATGFVESLASWTALVQPSVVHAYREVPGEFLTAGGVQVALAVVGLVGLWRRPAAWFFPVVGAVTAFLMTSWSAWFWQIAPLGGLMAFPWRLQSVLALATAIAATGLVLAVPPIGRGVARGGVGLALAVALAVAGLGGLQPTMLDVAPDGVNAASFAKFERFSNFIGTTSPVQFRPRTSSTDPATIPNAVAPDRPATEPPTIRLERFTPTAMTLAVQSVRPTTIRLPQFWFPGWHATVNGAQGTVRADGPLGLLAIDAPPGPTRVVVEFGDTPVRVVGGVVSLVGVVGLIVFVLAPYGPTPGSRRRERHVARFWALGVVALVGGGALTLWLSSVKPPDYQLVTTDADAGPLRLLAYRVTPDALGRGVTDVVSVWQTRGAVPDGTQAIVRLTDSDGHVIVAETRAPRFGSLSPARWAVGDIVWDRQALAVPPGTPATKLTLNVGWRLPDGQERVVAIATVPLPPTPAAPDLDVTPLDVAFANGIVLRGAQVTPIRPLPLGLALPAADNGSPPGLDVTLVWQTDRPIIDDLSVVLQLTDGRTALAQADSFPPLDLRYTSLWRPRWPVTQRYRLTLQPGAPGRYDLRVGLYERPSLRRTPVVGGSDSVTLWTYRIPPGAPSVVVDRRIGPVTLEGFDRLDDCGPTVSAGCALIFRLIWRVESAPNDDLTAFVHVLGPDGRLVAQRDGPPAEGRDPTRDWQRGDRIADERRIVLPPTAMPGEYQVVAGLYRSRDGARLPVADDPTGQNAAPLGRVTAR